MGCDMSDFIAKSKDVTLLEILDRVLDKGVIVSGDIVLLSSVETMEGLRQASPVSPMQETIDRNSNFAKNQK